MERRGFSKPRKPLTFEAAKLQMASLCAKAEHSELEIRQKLIKKGADASLIARVVEFLIANGFINDRRFAKAYVHDKSEFAKWGPQKIRIGLIQKGISTEIVSDALGNADESIWERVCSDLAKAKSQSMDLQSRDDLMKLHRFLFARGFTSEMVRKCVKELSNP